MKTTRLLKTSFMLAAGLIFTSAASQAAISYHITIGTASLALAPNVTSGPYSLDFQLNSGDTLSNNTATLSNFTFGGGSAFGAANSVGGASGDLGSFVSLTDTGAFNEFYQTFNAGSSIQFDLFLSQNVDGGPTPDVFTISLLNSSLSNITTNSTDGADTLLHLDINSSTAGSTYGDMNFTAGTGSYSAVAAVPEPSAALLGVATCVVGVLRRRRSN